MPFQIQQADDDDGDDADDADDDLNFGDGLPRGAILVLRGHHLAALGWVARSCVDPGALAGARAIAAALCARLRNRLGVAIARALEPLDVADPAYLDAVTALADGLRRHAESIGPNALAKVIDADTARLLTTSTTAWIPGGALPADEVQALAAHVRGGGEVWGGLGDTHRYLNVSILGSNLDPAGGSAFELGVDHIPARADAIAVEIRSRRDPELVLDFAHPLRLVRRGGLMVCLEVVPASATVDEAAGRLTLRMEDG